MIIQVIAGVSLGAIVGGIIGYAGKCAGGGCPLTCNPIGGIITGALIGFLVASSVPTSTSRSDKEIRRLPQETRATTLVTETPEE
jgi:outer membrane lipoprotein SlyB